MITINYKLLLFLSILITSINMNLNLPFLNTLYSYIINFFNNF